MKFKYIFWDNDGVLVDTEPLYLQASREALARVGITLCENLFARISLTEGRSVFDLAAQRGLPDGTIAELRGWRNARYAELLATQDLTIKGVREVLEALYGKVGMAVVTSSLKNHFEMIHRRTGLLDFFDFCLTRGDYIKGKPAAEPYLRALQLSGHRTEEALVIEDSPRGLNAAKSAGLTCWVIPGQQAREESFAQADRILRSIDEIPGLVM
jgi:HAD superfamily hydrolase (TIGR01509 family)